MLSRFTYTLRGSRLAAFLIMHTIVSVAAGAMALRSYAGHDVRVYALAFVEAFFYSIAGASLSILLLLKWLFFGYTQMPVTHLFSQTIALPALVGGCALLGVACLIFGAQNTRGWKSRYALFALASMLFVAAANNLFPEIGNLRLLPR
jgi:hypothetical protein